MPAKHEYRKSLDRGILKTLAKPTVWPWLFDACRDWLVIMISFYYICLFPNIFTALLCLLIIGNRQHALTILGHDGTHYTLLKNKKMNDFLTNLICFWPIGLTVSGYRTLHKKHHRHAGAQEDPELAHKKSRAPQWDLPTSPFKVLKYAALDIIGFSVPDYWIIITYSKPDKTSQYYPLIAMHIILVLACILVGFWWVPIIWYLALVTTFMMAFRLRLWLEHQGTSETHRLHLSYLQGALLAPHNSWMHWEHHNWPSIPYHRLPVIREHIKEVRIMKLAELITFFETCKAMKSGDALKVR